MKRVLYFVGTSRKDLLKFPNKVIEIVQQALYDAQCGEKHPKVKPLKGFGSSKVQEIAVPHFGDAYRTVYTLQFKDRIYVLHAFQKKSKHGIQTPLKDFRLIESRLKTAEEDYQNARKK